MGVPMKFLVLFVFYLLICRNGVEGNKMNIHKQEHIEIQRQLKLLNKPARKSIVTRTGDVYDCVDFHKQPTFDRYPLQNNNFEKVQALSQKTITISQYQKPPQPVDIGLKGDGCPFGTVPLKRATKNDLIRGKSSTGEPKPEPDPPVVPGIPHYAVIKTVAGHDQNTGAGAFMSIHNPSVSGGQYSAARLKLGFGVDSIEAGWRVDPTLYGGTQTRFYIRTDVGQTHCFNTVCPGFVVVSYQIPLDFIFDTVSQPGQDPNEIQVNIIRDQDGNWNLRVGLDNLLVGYWPKGLFNSTSAVVASYVEWGGEAYGPVGTSSPPMGSGDYIKHDTGYDASLRQVTLYENGIKNDAESVQLDRNADYYSVSDEGYIDEDYRHLVLYGGPGGKQ